MWKFSDPPDGVGLGVRGEQLVRVYYLGGGERHVLEVRGDVFLRSIGASFQERGEGVFTLRAGPVELSIPRSVVREMVSSLAAMLSHQEQACLAGEIEDRIR